MPVKRPRAPSVQSCVVRHKTMDFPFFRFAHVLLSLALLVAAANFPRPAAAHTAQNQALNSPVGRWRTVDDATGKAKSIVAIREENGKLYGTIETLFNPPVPHPTCYLCSGDLKDRPLVGLQVLWGFQQEGNRWSGGEVLDPETGKIYKASLALENGGKDLQLHGYIGVPLFGRTEHWVRVE
jgi:uncharacterized protein (DUF2147 family)